jgi:hypothetical protein
LGIERAAAQFDKVISGIVGGGAVDRRVDIRTQRQKRHADDVQPVGLAQAGDQFGVVQVWFFEHRSPAERDT